MSAILERRICRRNCGVEYKVEAGAEFCITPPLFDIALLETFLKRTEHRHIPTIASIWPLTSARNAEFMRDELRISVPQNVINRMARIEDVELPAPKASPLRVKCWSSCDPLCRV